MERRQQWSLEEATAAGWCLARESKVRPRLCPVLECSPLHLSRQQHDGPPAMSLGRLAEARTARTRVDSTTDMPAASHRRSQLHTEPTTHSVRNKADLTRPPPSRPSRTPSRRSTHARAIADADASTIAVPVFFPSSELTSPPPSFRGPLPVLDPAVEVRRGETTPQKLAKHSRRPKTHRPNKWSRGGAGSSDETGSDRKPHASGSSPPQSIRALHKQPSHTHIAAHNAAAHQGRLMAAAFGAPSGDSRRGVASPRPKGRGTARHCYAPVHSF
jgi:hypothetical protein